MSLFYVSTMASQKRMRAFCFTEIPLLGIENYHYLDSHFLRDKRVSKLIQDIKKSAPDIETYASNFHYSNGHWPTVAQVKTHMEKRFQRMH
jgi:hypothetical protein